jgi:hypothetical protein
VLEIRVLSLGDPERYAVRRIVLAAEQELLGETPGLQIRLSEGKDAGEIGRYARVLVLPTLLINGKVVCTGRFPSRDEVVGWMRQALNPGG